MKRNEIIASTSITQGDGQCFYGYYDNPAWSRDGKYHLYHRVSFWNRLPKPEDSAELGMIDLESGEMVQLGTTTAWNFQQGSMLQWNPTAPNDEVIFNVRDGEEYRGAIQNVHTGVRRLLTRPVANVDPTGRHALSISFNRMFDFRPGYGYSGKPDPHFEDPHPADDGVFLVDLTSGASRLVLSLNDIWQHTKSFLTEDHKILINHINFNTDGSRFVFLARYFPKEGPQWGTAVITANTDGSDLYCLTDYTYASHYHWRDRDNLLIHAWGNEGPQLYLFGDKSQDKWTVDSDFFLKDGHCSYSPDRAWILYDSYPDKEHMRHLYLYSVEKKRGLTLGSYYSIPTDLTDCRCDLHPRWSPSGTKISFDSTHEGKRQIYTMELADVMENGF